VETVDLYPTLCELAGLPAPAGLDGSSVVPILKNPALPGKGHAFHVYPRGKRIGRAVRTNRHRLVEWKIPGAARESAEIELYDYSADPAETRNLASEQPETVRRLAALIDTLPPAKPQWRPAD
jgi:iduronate 2-sulfatase